MDPSSSGAPRPALQPPTADDHTSSSSITAHAGSQGDEVPAAAATATAVDAEPAADTAHLARFEFSNDGTTKILMVEWYPDAVYSGESVPAATAPSTTTTTSGDDGGHPGSDSPKSAIGPGPGDAPPATSSAVSSSPVDKPSHPADAVYDAWHVSWPGKSTSLPARDTDADGARRRVYFLLPPDAPIPTTVTVARPGRPSLELKPLPAIFPEGFAAEVGTRGVLHTIWARKRLSELEHEIEAEMRTNAESVGLEMALAEKLWIVDNFIRAPTTTTQPPSPVATRSADGVSRLGDKLKGLKLATSPADLVPSPTANTFTSASSQSHTFSPGGADIAVSSFSAISNASANAGPISLDAIVKGDVEPASLNKPEAQDTEDDLFAMPLSPRSPDMKTSPFSALR